MMQAALTKRLTRLETALLRNRPPTTPAERARRKEARDGLLPFTRQTFPPYRADAAHELIAEALDTVVAGKTRRLMIFAPPQHGKSLQTSVHLPAFWLGRRPDDPVILASYAASLAESKSRQARQIVESAEFSELFPGITTRRDSRAVDHWQLAGHGGGMLAVGVGGPITGHGAMLGIIDDPLENWEQAQSQTVREKVWEWYRTTFRTRIWEGGAIIVIMTRWHEQDLAGKLLAEQPGEWEVLRLPALAETQHERDMANRRLGLPMGVPDPLWRAHGEPLCPQRFSKEALEELRRDVGSLAWAGQYQGVPSAPEGNRFKRAWFTVVDAAPSQAYRLRAWDKAGTAGGGCYTVGALLARNAAGIFYVEDIVRGQWSAHERDQIMLQTARRDAAQYPGGVYIWVEQEPGSGGKESAQATVRLLAGFAVSAETVTGSKEIRAEPFAAQAEAGNVRLVKGPWNAAYLDELAAFPTGTHKDQVDASAAALNKLAQIAAGYCLNRPLITSATEEEVRAFREERDEWEAGWRSTHREWWERG
jgi:predicted phage terminase large subunit-like protein